MLLAYLYCLGTCRWRSMPFRPPFLATGKQFIKNTSSHRIKLIKQLFCWFIHNQAQALLPSPFQRGSLCRIEQIYTSHAIGTANSSPLWWYLLLSCAGGRWYFPYYSYCRKATEWEFFIPAWTLVGVILLITFPNFVRWQCLKTQNVHELFLFMFAISHFYAAYGINDVSEGPFWVPKFMQLLAWAIVRLLAKSCVLLVICVCSQHQWPWRPPGQCGAGTRPMAASSGF